VLTIKAAAAKSELSLATSQNDTDADAGDVTTITTARRLITETPPCGAAIRRLKMKTLLTLDVLKTMSSDELEDYRAA
jgi:hypothetical protein